jgi:PilZ domain
MSDEATIASNRRAARDSLFLNTEIRVQGVRDPIPVRVRNLSATGMMVDGHPAFTEGAEIVTDLRGIGDVKGRIAWTMAQRAGVAFDEEIDPVKARTPTGQVKHVTYQRPPVDQTSRPGLKVR